MKAKQKQKDTASEIEKVLTLKPPAEIDDGHDIPRKERHRHRGEQFGSLSNMKPETRERINYGARPGGSAPDKRTRIDPETANVPVRTGGPVMF